MIGCKKLGNVDPIGRAALLHEVNKSPGLAMPRPGLFGRGVRGKPFVLYWLSVFD